MLSADLLKAYDFMLIL